MPDKGGALLFISKDLNYNVGSNLQIHKEKELESIFIEVLSKPHKLLNEKKMIMWICYIMKLIARAERF